MGFHAACLECPGCGFVLQLQDGIWRALPPEREQYFQPFIRDYEAIRQAEGRGSQDADYYLALPFHDLSGKLAWQWKIRKASYRALERRVWPQLERSYPNGGDLLDIGCGNGWLCYRAALRGHRPVAVDLTVNDLDGLGAARHYLSRLSRPFPRFQAEMDRLPFAKEQFDIVLFNASLHYSVDYSHTLNEALRCLRSRGHLLILDSPAYHHESTGLAMVEEKHRGFAQRHGIRSDAIPSQEFLTFERLDELGTELHLKWTLIHPWYGLGWFLRPWKARLQRKREPSKFCVIWGQKA